MKHKTKEEIEHLLQSYQTYSGSQKDFCKEYGIKASTLYYWRRKLSRAQIVSKGSKFIPLEVEEKKISEQIEISYPNGNKIRLPIATSISLVEHLLQIHC